MARFIGAYLWENEVISSAAVSQSVEILLVNNYAVELSWTDNSSSGASLVVQASNTGEIWNDISGTTIGISGTGSQIFDFWQAGYRHFRVSASISSGSITTTVFYYGKGA